MSFFITLPSNSSQTVYEKNTQARFKTKLKNPIYLDGSYEVALVEILYPISSKYRPDGIIKISTDDVSIDYKLEFFKDENLSDLINRMNNDFKLFNLNISPTIEYHFISKRIYLFIPENVGISFMNNIHETLGFDKSEYIGINNITIKSSEIITQCNSENSNFYIYSDIIEYQIVGNDQSPLLRIIHIDDVKKGLNFASKIFDSPHYIPVSRNNIDVIEIEIRNNLGSLVYFTKGEVVVKLHFKRKSFY